MATPEKPPLNGRIIAEFYLSSETAKRAALREYAQPKDNQRARIIMYDLIRRVIPEYFQTGRSDLVLERVGDLVAHKQFENSKFDEQWHRANRLALLNLRNFKINGEFKNVSPKRVMVEVEGLEIYSTADFYGTFVPKATKGVPRLAAVIVNPAGIKKPSIDQRRMWARIESEVAFRAAEANRISVTDVLYLDLRKNELHRTTGPRSRIWSEIEATCERIRRDWREIRAESSEMREAFG